jgi:spermidine synthase
MPWLFAFFLTSGFCSLVYQVVWLRLAMADFGVNTLLVSIVLSVFMGGLALGSWGAGSVAHRLAGRPASVFLRLYGGMEFLIGVSGLLVVPALGLGRRLLAAGGTAPWGSGYYYLASGAWITLALLPFCACMGATFPLAMAGVRAAFPDESPRSFSFLYLANVLGAMAGTLGSAFVLIETLGFRGTLGVAVLLNFLIAISALTLSRSPVWIQMAAVPNSDVQEEREGPRGGSILLALLFTSGLASLAMEVVWVRQFVSFQGPLVYAFATIVALYLAATATGSRVYRAWVRRRGSGPDAPSWAPLAALSGVFGLLPLLAADPRLPLPPGLRFGTVRVALGIVPFCGVLGFMTPMLLDRYSGGDPRRAGRAYALNAVGCIVGPVLAAFGFLPAVGETSTLVLLSLSFFAFGLACWRRAPAPNVARRTVAVPRAVLGLSLGISALLVLQTKDYEALYPGSEVRRDHTATVIATGQGMDKELLVNGVGMTVLTPITKLMVHLPMAFLDPPPERGLVLCFGMGTSFRSMLAWDVPTTAVELVPSVPGLFGFFQPGHEGLLRSPLARVVIDDARRFLERSRETYSVVVIDPPPPVEAAGSSLLYSREFYASARRRLGPGGILQQWLPKGEATVVTAVTRALTESFPYVRAFTSVEGWGIHFLASDHPIPARSAAELAARVPAGAVRDLVEWGPHNTARDQFQAVIGNEIPLPALLQADPAAPAIGDNRPVNEYYFLRRHGLWSEGR